MPNDDLSEIELSRIEVQAAKAQRAHVPTLALPLDTMDRLLAMAKRAARQPVSGGERLPRMD